MRLHRLLLPLSVPDFEGEAVGFVQDTSPHYNPSLRARSEGLARRPQKSNRSMKVCIYAAQHIDRSSEVVPANGSVAAAAAAAAAQQHYILHT